MTSRNLPQISVPIAILYTELFQGFFSQLTKISDLHSSTLYNNGNLMSREKHANRNWGNILMKLRLDAGLTVEGLAKAMGYPKGKGKISEIENGKLPIKEEKIRLWVNICGKRMFDFYWLANDYDAGIYFMDKFETKKDQSE